MKTTIKGDKVSHLVEETEQISSIIHYYQALYSNTFTYLQL